jgi:hypothetical protein
VRRLRSWTLQEPQIERRKHQDNSDVYYRPLPEVMPEEQDIYADHNGYQREHVKHEGRPSSHRFVLLCAMEWSKNGVSAGAHIYGNFTARTSAQVCYSARRNLQVSNLGWTGIHDRDKVK